MREQIAKALYLEAIAQAPLGIERYIDVNEVQEKWLLYADAVIGLLNQGPTATIGPKQVEGYDSLTAHYGNRGLAVAIPEGILPRGVYALARLDDGA